jgi:hypothetical protein
LVIIRNYDTLWRENATEQRRRRNFKVKRLKEKCLDQFLNQWGVQGEEKPLIVYGAVSMNPSGKGELAVPVKHVYENVKESTRQSRADERNTTKMHYKYEKSIGRVKVGVKDTRGLRWCPTCSELVSRDRNACKEYFPGKRDQGFCATPRRGRKEVQTKVLPKRGVKWHGERMRGATFV